MEACWAGSRSRRVSGLGFSPSWPSTMSAARAFNPPLPPRKLQFRARSVVGSPGRRCRHVLVHLLGFVSQHAAPFPHDRLAIPKDTAEDERLGLRGGPGVVSLWHRGRSMSRATSFNCYRTTSESRPERPTRRSAIRPSEPGVPMLVARFVVEYPSTGAPWLASQAERFPLPLCPVQLPANQATSHRSTPHPQPERVRESERSRIDDRISRVGKRVRFPEAGVSWWWRENMARSRDPAYWMSYTLSFADEEIRLDSQERDLMMLASEGILWSTSRLTKRPRSLEGLTLVFLGELRRMPRHCCCPVCSFDDGETFDTWAAAG